MDIIKPMNKNKIRAIAILAILLLMFLSLIIYAVTNSAFNFHANTYGQKPKTGLGYARAGRTDYKSPDVFLLGDFTTNLATHDRAGKFVRVEIRVKMSDRDMAVELKRTNILLRDAVIEEMSLKRFSELSTEKGKMKLKENIKNRLNQIISDGEIEEVYFTQFIIQ